MKQKWEIVFAEHSDLNIIWDTPPYQGASTHQIWDSYLKYNKGYAPDTIILKTRSEVKDTVTQWWYTTGPLPKMHAHTKFGIPTSINIRDMLRTCRF